jgi:hypothetical protein
MRILCLTNTGVFKLGPILEMFNKSGYNPLIHGVLNITNIGFSFKKHSLLFLDVVARIQAS